MLEQERVLRGLLLIMFCVTAGQAAAEAPFVPPGISPPDYEVTTTVTKSYDPKEGSQIVIHHDHWTRATPGRDSPNGVYYAGNGVAIEYYAGGIDIRRRRLRWDGIDYEAHNTGERQTHLGESCTVWETLRSKPDYGRLKSSESSCVTDDGIELWHRSIYGGEVQRSVEATNIERRPVADNEVHPPRPLLALDWWQRDTPMSSTKPDHEIIMEPAGNAKPTSPPIQTVRRSGPWQFKEQIGGRSRRIEIARDASWARLYYTSDEFGVPDHLAVTQLKFAPPMETRTTPTDLGRTDTILGETCRWYRMDPGVADGGTIHCLSEDGLVLKETLLSWGSARTWIATRLTRRPVSIDEIKPPVELLEPHTWGLD